MVIVSFANRDLITNALPYGEHLRAYIFNGDGIKWKRGRDERIPNDTPFTQRFFALF